MLDRHVRHGVPVFRHDCRQLKTSAKNRFVPTREKSAGVSRFKLRSEHDLFRAADLLLVRHVEKSLALLIDLARKAQRERVVAGCKFRLQREDEQFVLLVGLNCRLGKHLTIKRRVCDFELEGIQYELTNRAANAELNRFRSSECELVDIRDDPNGIFYREDLFRQFSRCGCELERLFCIHGRAEHNEK